MIDHDFVGPYCRACSCGALRTARAAREAAELAEVAEFCSTHPDGIYWVEYEGSVTIASLTADRAPHVWGTLDGDESALYTGVKIDEVKILGGPISPPAGMRYGEPVPR